MSHFQLIIRRENTDFESKLSFTAGESLLLLCKKSGISIETPCNGKGICGKCKVKFIKNPPLPQPAERRSLSPQELRQGIRLACAVKLAGDCEVLIFEEKKPDVVGGKYDIRWEAVSHSDTSVINQHPVDERNVDNRYSTDECDIDGYFIAADIGTTTLVMEKRKKSDGRVEAVYKEVNAQRAFGADVLTRMEASLSGKGKELSEKMVKQLEKGIGQLCADGKKADFMVIAANTTMVHLLMNYSVERLSRAPFIPESLDEIITEIGGIKTFIMPGFSAFVGGDIGAGLYMLDFLKNKSANEESGEYRENREVNEYSKWKPDESKKWNLFIDLGTNAELVLFSGNSGICCATAAGPAFDGDAGTGFFGSDMIAVLAELLEKGIVDENGTLDDAHFKEGVSVAVKGGTMQISQKQIRNLQLAKAAVRSGIEMLLQKAGIETEQIGHVFLAGGFGYYLDVHGAVKIGLLPKQLEDRTEACGNTALLGAAVYGHKILTGEDRSLPIEMKAINLAEEEKFTESYVNYINLS
ncbi:MAG: DUF4445 domain-containing protein [Lachnospiraceae bacterium]|nr:DUF4445 domain-containing protein [Lachnospiraceae bacterium]